ncbi:MAG: ABC transporter substrate-binding protein [Chloroflexi bacterium]|nr:ABC transporter substrate-binding protein [Chloroflexota bacterium]
MPHRRMGFFLIPLVALSLLLAACGDIGNEKIPGSENYPATNANGEVMIDHLDFGAFGGGSNPQVNYNPFSPNVLSSAYIFEPLMVMDNYSCQLHPWLATASNWQDPQTLQFTIRDGVKWNDGQPFSADDVVYTFNLTKKVPAFDSTGVWQALDSVSNQGNIVTFKFKEPSSQMLSKVAAQLIVPKHVWETVDDPVKFTNDKAVGTGPYMPTSFNGRLLVLGINQNYWQVDKLRVNQLVFHRTEGGSSVDQLNLAQGKYDTNAMFIPNIQSVFVDKDPDHNFYWFPPGGAISLGFNLTKAPFNDVEFRKAMSYAIDRDAIANKAEYGYVKTASQTGLVLPGQKDWLDPSIQNQGMIGYDPKQAAAILEKAGYKKNGSGQLTGKDGQPIEINFEVQNGYTDWIQAAQIIQQNLRALGITVNVTTPAAENVESDRANGRFDLVYDVHGGSCNMYDNYFLPLSSKQSAEIGKPAASNFIRWQDPNTDKLIDQLRSATSEEDQKPIVYQLQKIMMDQLPTVPLWYGGVWFQYTTNRATGWPNADNPYAKPTDNLLIITSLKPSPDYKPPQ